jgi:glycosyltransferase involved in cell wall biosynthesis
MPSADSGVGSLLIGLATGLSSAGHTDEYVFLTYPGHDEWLRAYLGSSCRALGFQEAQWKGFARRRLPGAVAAWQQGRRLAGQPEQRGGLLQVPNSDGALEAEGVEVIQFPSQAGFITDVPSIYHPHDLQHLHLPEYFTAQQIAQRELIYRTLCGQATVVAVASNWVKRDLVHHYGLAPDKVQVIPLAPLLGEYPEPTHSELARTAAKYRLPNGFIFYPAQTWPHKNHIMLLEALAILRRDGLVVPLVASGRKTDFFRRIDARAHELGVHDQVRFLGFVTPLELQILYRLSRGVVIPTKFEAASFPLWEAFLAGAPAACSSVTSLPEQAGGAALLFDPCEPEAIAAAIRSLVTDEDLRSELVERASAKVSHLNWRSTAGAFRVLYKKVSGRQLDAGERRVLAQANEFL